MVNIASSELNLRELRILHALLHERSITRTAELLATTQPGISKVLRHLRAQFGDPLFVRNGHAMQPTAKALEIADQLRTLLGVADSLRASATAFDPVRSDRTFSLLLTDVGMVRFLPPLIAHVATIAPRVNIRAMPLDSRQFELKLEAGEADLALGAAERSLTLGGRMGETRMLVMGHLSVGEIHRTLGDYRKARSSLERVLEQFRKLKVRPVAALELEFYLIDRDRDAKGHPQPPLCPRRGVRETTA